MDSIPFLIYPVDSTLIGISDSSLELMIQEETTIPPFQPKQLDEKEQSVQYDSSLILLISLLISLLTIVFTKSRDGNFYRNQYKKLWQLPKLKNKDIKFAKPFVNVLNSISLIAISCLALKFSFGQYFGFNDDLTLSFFLILIVVLFILNSAKWQIEKGIAGLLDIQVYQEAYHVWLNSAVYFLIYPISILTIIAINLPESFSLGIGISVCCVLMIFYILKVIKQFLMVQQHPLIKTLYLSLYLCTLEILPLLVGIHFLIKN